MKVSDFTTKEAQSGRRTAQVVKAAKGAAQGGSVTAASGDKVNVSELAAQLAEALKELPEAPLKSSSAERLAALKNAIDHDTYPLDSIKTASAMLQE